MKNVFTNILTFSILYFALVLIDFSSNFFEELYFVKYVAKPLLIVLLIGFYANSEHRSSSGKFVFLIIALGFFLLGIVATLFNDPLVYKAAIVFFILGKVFYIFRFSNQKLFKMVRFLTFLIIYMLYMVAILYFTLEQLSSFLITVSLFLFVSLMVVQFAFLRKDEVSHSSYQHVLIGVFIMFFTDTLAVLSAFYFEWVYMRALIVILYAISQYLIITGLVREKIDTLRFNYPKTE